MNNSLKNLRMGYCCLNMELRERDIFASRTCRLDTLKKNGMNYLYDLVNKNLRDLETILTWNFNNKIFLYRMSSEMFPFASHPDYYKDYNLEQFRTTLRDIGKLAKKYKQRLTFHPGQYNQLTSCQESVVEKTIIDIDIHAKIMDMMELDQEGVIVIHGGGKKPSKAEALSRFMENFYKLSESSQRRLVLENCEMAYSIEDLVPVSEKLGVPIVIDYHHHNINPGSITELDQLIDITKIVLKIWIARGITPLFHLSESREGVTISDNITVRRAHSDYVHSLPDGLLIILQEHRIDLDLEAKMKERAVKKLNQLLNMD
jgi:UV damage endonuclease UvdE